MNSLTKPNILEVLKPGGENKRGGGDSTDHTVNKTATEYLRYYGDQSGERKDKAADVANHYYDLVTDFYEYGWGESFHFAVHARGESREHSFAKHEYRVALKLQLERGETALDIGCGVGGPARHIASFTDAKIIGVNINDYQLKRARLLTKMANLEHLCSFVKADFTAMPFDDNAFEKVYAIESTCHCAQLSKVYSEVFRVLKPGGIFVSYEWIATDKYQPTSHQHKDIVAGILEGDGLPRLNTIEDVHKAVRVAGFELVDAEDHAVKSEVPWYHVLQPQWTLSDFKITPLGRFTTSMMLSMLETLRLTPRGATKIHRMLCKGADNLVRGGQEGIFSPMYFVVMRKPAASDI